MSFKFRCRDCSFEFYPRWYIDDGENLIDEKCPECQSDRLEKLKLDQKQLLDELQESLRKNGNGCGG